MDEELEVQAAEPEEKISFVVGILGTIIAVTLDLLSLIPFVGDIEEVPAGVILFLNIISGMGTTVLAAQGTAMLLKAIPVVQELPLWTIAWGMTWYMENHPSRLTAAIETVGKLEALAEGGAANEAGAATEGAEMAEGAATATQEAGAVAEAAEGAATGAGTGAAEAEGSAERGPAPERPSERTTERDTVETRKAREAEGESGEIEGGEEEKTESQKYQEELYEKMGGTESYEEQAEREEEEIALQRTSDGRGGEGDGAEAKNAKIVEMPKQQSDTEISLEKRRAKVQEVKDRFTKQSRPDGQEKKVA